MTAQKDTRRSGRITLKKMLLLASAIASTIVIDAEASGAQAQTIDYDTFETMFGEPVTSSATGKPQRESELSADTQIITSDQISRMGANTIPGVLRMVAGLDVRRYGMIDENVSVRGNDAAGGSHTLVLLNGRQVYQDGYNFMDWGVLPAAIGDIRQIEIVRGPNSALYGFNASGGVINIVTRDPLYENRSFVSVKGGSQNYFGGSLVLSHKFSDFFAAKLTVDGMRSKEFTPGNAINVTPTVMTFKTALDLRGKITPNIDWLFSASASKERQALWLDFGSYVHTEPTMRSLIARIDADTSWGLFEIKAYSNRYSTENDLAVSALGENFPINFDYTTTTTVVQASDIIAVNNANDIRLGVEYRNTSLAAKSSGQLLGSQIENLAAASATWTWRIAPRLTMTTAFRLDALTIPTRSSRTIYPRINSDSFQYIEPTFNTKLRYDAVDAGIFGITVARGVQLPPLFDFSPSTMFGPVNFKSNSSLVPATTINVGADYSHRIPKLNANFTLALFAQRTNNMLGTPFATNFTFVPPAQILVSPHNYGRVDDIGGEAKLDGKTDFGLHWSISYAMASVRDLDQSSPINFQRQTPVNSVIGGVDYTRKKFEISTHARWQSHYQDVQANFKTLSLENAMVKNFVTINARIAWNFSKHFVISLNGNQLNAPSLRTTGGIRTQRQLIGMLKADF
ncbi:hypothetical protein HK28_13740 [Acetobacter sp. DsW_063]|nr:hypothetical protein HK28_13740 [Acetobacter sp. DsW_063]